MSGGKKLGEFDIIRDYFMRQRVRREDVWLGIGDDGAVLDAPPGGQLVVAVDTLNADIHFPRGAPARAIGYRALAVNLSDLAAMGAEPAWATLVLSLQQADPSWLGDFAKGFFELAERHEIMLIGGDTIRGPLSVTVAAYGFVPSQQALLRSGAHAGDHVWVSGTLGDAAAGLDLLRAPGTRSEAETWLIERFLRPEPRVRLGMWLRQRATAVIDVSDGLVADLDKLATASGVGAVIQPDDLPISSALMNTASEQRCAEFASVGGDDYELCFTMPPTLRGEVESAAGELGCRLSRIGEITAERQLVARSVDGEQLLHSRGYDHFG